MEDLRVQAASQGVEWLRIALSHIHWKEIRALATAADVKRKGADGNWLSVAQLRSELLNALMVATQARMYKICDVFLEPVVDMRRTCCLAGVVLCQLHGFVWSKLRLWRAEPLESGLMCCAQVGRRRTTRKSRRRLPNWKISVYKQPHRALSGFVSLCCRFLRRRFGLWPLLQG